MLSWVTPGQGGWCSAETEGSSRGQLGGRETRRMQGAKTKWRRRSLWPAVSNSMNESSKIDTLILEQRIDFLIEQLRAPSKSSLGEVVGRKALECHNENERWTRDGNTLQGSCLGEERNKEVAREGSGIRWWVVGERYHLCVCGWGSEGWSGRIMLPKGHS